MSENEKNVKSRFNVGFVFLLSLAIFAQEITWNFYDAQVQAMLRGYISSLGVVGFIMGLDNLLGLFLEPMMGNLSDNTRSKIGRRMPYIILGVPLSALFFILIPFETSLATLILFSMLYVSVMLAYKAPTESLVPDFIQKKNRSKANAIVKIMTSISIVITGIISNALVDINLKIAFMVPAAIMIIAFLIFIFTVHEKNSPAYQEILADKEEKTEKGPILDREKIRFMATLKNIFRSEDKSTKFMLLAILAMGISWSAMRASLTNYGMLALGLTQGEAGSFTLYGGIAFLLLAYPIAMGSEKFGRILFCKIGFVIFVIGLILGFAIKSQTFLMISVILTTVGYAFIIVNAIVIIWGLAPNSKVTGTYTGLFYLFFYGASSIGPMLVGFMTDLTGIDYMMLNTCVFAIMGFVFMLYVRKEQ
jgi:Na+/melibiose symporter-like transporter